MINTGNTGNYVCSCDDVPSLLGCFSASVSESVSLAGVWHAVSHAVASIDLVKVLSWGEKYALWAINSTQLTNDKRTFAADWMKITSWHSWVWSKVLADENRMDRRAKNIMPPATAVASTQAYKCCEFYRPLRCNLPTSSLSSAWMKRGRAKPTCASSVMRTRYSELLNFGALSFLSINRMVKVVVTVALVGVRSSFSSVA